MKKTEWFVGVVPAQTGPFEVTTVIDGAECFQHWNGKFWGHRKPTPQKALEASAWPSETQSPTWRGLTEETPYLPTPEPAPPAADSMDDLFGTTTPGDDISDLLG
jgi:hypothetical protein